MTDHYFENDWVKLHYYKFGEGLEAMLCFHGFGMHGRQFKMLESALGLKYTFYSFDLFFHEKTKLKDQSLLNVKKGLAKKELSLLIADFCRQQGIQKFSVIGYSIGTHYATVLVEELPTLVNEYIAVGPASLNPGKLVRFFGKNKYGNKFIEKVALSKSALPGMIKLLKRLAIINQEEYKILFGEVGTEELRFNFYACLTYMRFLDTDENRLVAALNGNKIKSIFIFGRRDKSFPPGIGDKFIRKLNQAEVVILEEGHEMMKKDFISSLTKLLT